VRTGSLLLVLGSLVACTGPGDTAETDSDTDTDTAADSELCAVEAELRTEQTGLGLTVPSVCADMTDLGDTTLVAEGALPAGTDFSAVLGSEALKHRAEFEGNRRLYAFMGITISVPSDSREDTELALLTAQAWKAWSETSSFAILADMEDYPAADPLDCCAWKNRFDQVVVSLDPSPLDIGASVSIIGPATTEGDEQRYTNAALFSIDRETVLGDVPAQGSQPIYQAADARENLLRYFADGAVFTFAHEATHLYIDQRNSVSAVANRIWDGRNFANGAYVSAEEVVANYTACTALSGELSAEMLAFNRDVTQILLGYAGVPERMDDLRTYSVVGSERLKLTASEACGG